MSVQTCAICGAKVEVPETSEVNHCTVVVHHHYGSPKDGDVETYDVCVSCITKLLVKAKPTKVEHQW